MPSPRCRDLLLDQLGCQLIGATMPWNQPVYRFVKDTKSGGPARIVKYGDQVPLDDAVLVNGTFAQGCELDDYYDQGGGHPGAATVPVILALAQKQRVTGQELMTAMVAGYEVGWRVGRALLPELMRRGYHAQSAVGVFIAAAAAGKILRLDPAADDSRAGHCRQPCRRHDGVRPERRRGKTLAQRHGVLRRAPLGAAGADRPYRSADDFRRRTRHSQRDVGRLQCRPDRQRSAHRQRRSSALPCGDEALSGQCQPAFAHRTARSSSPEHNIEASQVAKINVGVNEGILLHGGTIYQPKEVIEAQFSLRFSLALRLLKGNNDLRHYLDPAMWSDPAMLESGKKIELFGDPTAVGARRFACQMKIQLSRWT